MVAKMPRVIGTKGSMISLIKKYTACRLVVGQNGRIWIDGVNDDILIAIGAVSMISDQAHVHGLTNNVKEYLQKAKGIDPEKEAEEERKAAEEEKKKAAERAEKARLHKEQEEEKKAPVPVEVAAIAHQVKHGNMVQAMGDPHNSIDQGPLFNGKFPEKVIGERKPVGRGMQVQVRKVHLTVPQVFGRKEPDFLVPDDLARHMDLSVGFLQGGPPL